jgi:DNA-binding NtrC family response regulator
MEEKPLQMATRTMVADVGADLQEQRCSLVEVEGPEPGRVHPIGANRTVVGKSPDCDIPIADVTVSRQHFEVLNEGARYLVKDLGSTNGTLLDGAAVKEAYLRPGALLKAGEVVFRFQTEYDPVRIAPSSREAFGGLLGRSLRMREIFALLEKVSVTDSTVLLLGETGTGKGAAASAIHQNSRRGRGPFLVVDCGAVATNLIESELFGHVKGAFTVAVGLRKGALELQPKLLRAIEDRVFVRLGANQPIKFDARLVAASKKDLWKEVAAGRFREDLYFRLSVVTIRLPSLRERPEDIPLLFDNFSGPAGPRYRDLPPEAQNRWSNHSWPGNVRELRNAVERSRALEGDGLEGFLQSRSGARAPGTLAPDYSLPFKDAKEKLQDAFEREYLKRLLLRAEGGIAGAARLAGIDRKHLYKLLEKHGLDKKKGDG